MKVKIQTHNGEFSGYLVNGTTFFPKENCEQIKQWIAQGNTPEPEFTDEELQITSINKQIQEAKTYLATTAWYVERLNDPSSGKAIPEDVLAKRSEARELINTLEILLQGANNGYNN